MNRITRLALLTFLTIIFQSAIGQKLYSFAPDLLYGTWQVVCTYDESDEKATTVCSLCPLIVRDNGFTIQGITMKISKAEIILNFNEEKKSSVKYKWDDIAKALEFNFKEVNYKFTVIEASIYPSPSYILRNKDGRLLVLIKPKK
jgi:hypothetical protein